MPTVALTALALVAVVVVAGACTGVPAATPAPTASAPAGTADPTRIPTETPGLSLPAPATPVPGDDTLLPQGILAAILEDAATRTGAPPADIAVVTALAVTWPNGALGCPQPGFMYTDRIEPGYQVVVEAGGKRLDYRVGSSGVPQLCENPPGPG